MNEEIQKAIEYSEKLISAAIDVVGAAKVELDGERARHPKIIGLTILCRSISNFRASLLLVQQRHVMEARALGRCLYENLLWIGALRERGSDFVQDMLQDEAFNRKSLGELTLKITSKHGADLNSSDSLTLRSLMRDIGTQFPETKKLNANRTAAEGEVEIAYVEYLRLSLDGVHCSVTALGRHLRSEHVPENHELIVTIEANTTDREMLAAIIDSCRALIGVAIGANEILGFTTATEPLAKLSAELQESNWATGSKKH